MKKEIIVLLLFVLTSIQTSFAQKIELKNGKILLDKKEILSYKKANEGIEFTIYKLNTEEEELFVITNNTQIVGFTTNYYTKIKFQKLKLKLETSIVKETWRKFVEWLYDNKVFNDNGEFNKEKVELFIEKYDEKILN